MEGKKITKNEFDKMTQKYQKQNEGKTRSVTFDKALIKELLDDPSTHQVSIFFAENEEGLNTVALIGVDADNKLTSNAVNAGRLCPPNCNP